MNFKEFPPATYEQNTLFEVIFQARFPKIWEMSTKNVAGFQDIVRKEGYPESAIKTSSLPPDMPEEMRKQITPKKEFLFFSEEKDWKISLTNDFIALTCNGAYSSYKDFRERIERLLITFKKIYEPVYFSRIGLRYRNIVNKRLFPVPDGAVKDYVPDYILPELTHDVAENLLGLDKFSEFEDDNMRANVSHSFGKISGKFGNQQLSDEESYLIDIDCYCKDNLKEVSHVLTKCDSFKKIEWNIFQWSISDRLRELLEHQEKVEPRI